MTYSHMDNPTLPSALRGFPSEFGKGSGGSLLLLSPAQLFYDYSLGLTSEQCSSGNGLPNFNIKWVINRYVLQTFELIFYLAFHKSKSSCLCLWFEPQTQLFGCCIVKPHEQLVLVSFTCITVLPHPTYQRRSLQRLFRGHKSLREILSW